MQKCSYCGEEYEFPKGMTLVLANGNPKYFCCAKCRKNYALKRRKVRWVSKKKKE